MRFRIWQPAFGNAAVRRGVGRSQFLTPWRPGGVTCDCHTHAASAVN